MDNCPRLSKSIKKNVKKNDFFIFDYLIKNIKKNQI